MTLIGVTGGIGMGKSTACRFLEALSVPWVDTDALARDCSRPGTDGFQEIVKAFGPGMVGATGELDRGRLADIVFRDAVARRRLEAILHPRIAAGWRSLAAGWRGAGVACAAVVIPLLYEKEYAAEFTRVVCVACGDATQASRLRARGWTSDQIRDRNAAQLPVSEKMVRADYVIWTEGTLETHRQQWARIVAGLVGA